MDYPKSDPTARLLSDKFTDGDPVNGIPASRDSADYQNMVFDELINVISQAGLEPDEGDLTQLAAAVVALVGGTFDVRAWGTNDYVRIPDKPGGLIIQWGMVGIAPSGPLVSSASSSVPVTWPITFPNAYLRGTCVCNSQYLNSVIESPGLSGGTINTENVSDTTGSGGAEFIVIGY